MPCTELKLIHFLTTSILIIIKTGLAIHNKILPTTTFKKIYYIQNFELAADQVGMGVL